MIPNIKWDGEQAIQDCLRDVTSLATLPMMWAGAEPIRIAESLGAALYTTLTPEFVYVEFSDDAGETLASVAQVDRYESSPDLAGRLSALLREWACEHDPDDLLQMPNPLHSGALRVTTRALGYLAKHGLIAAGFANESLPSPAHHLIMNVAASQAATGIRNALLLRSQREAEARFRALVDVSAQIVWTTDGTGRVIRDSPSWRAFTGQTFEQWKDSGWLDAIHPDDRDRVSGLWRTAVRERTPVHTEYRLRHVSGDWRWTTVRAVPRLDADGSVREWVGMNIDITQQKSAETTQRLLVSELNHRVKNTLASVQAIAQQTLRRAKNPADFVASFGGRIQALARVHTQLTETSWQSADLEKLVRDQLLLVSVEASQLTMSGPTVGLQPQMALHLAMVLHELATNSCKYGSLSQSTGTVSVEWRISDGSLSLKWAESGGPTVSEPAHAGFGTVMVKQSIRAQGGEAHMSWKPGGIQWEISLPLPGLQPLAIPAYVNGGPPDSTALADASLNGGGQTPLKGNRILIVEDEFVIALSISSCLQEVGAVPVGPAYTVEQALRLIESQRLNGALLDANLGGSTVEEIAGALTRYDIPFAFVTGYSRDTLPPRYRHAPVLAKPFNPGQLIGLVRDMLSSAHEAASDVKVALPREATGLGC